VRNDLEGLRKSRASLGAQKYKNWQHIIVDGASTDGTVEYLKTLSKENTIYISEVDTGVYNAMNKAWKIASPDSFVFFLNARDTFADNESLEAASVAFVENSSSNWGCTTHEEIGENGDNWVCKLVATPSIPNQLYAFGYRSHQAVVMKASFMQRLGGFDETYEIASDWDLIVRALKAEIPTVWWHSLGRFELGGLSSNQLLLAHLELRALRHKYLEMHLRRKLAESIWSAIFLGNFGFRNRWSKLLPLILLARRSNDRRKRKHLSQRSIYYIVSEAWRNTGKFKFVGDSLRFINILRSRIRIRLKFKMRYTLTRCLHRTLGISGYVGK
jgi:glycosyltransferase involved in cell wall biosynthesis